MAGNIKGITIEFNGDTTKLDKALRSIDKSTSQIDRELKKVNNGLKFNPTSVELWRQKQQLLTQKITETKRRLDVLKQAQADMDARGVDKNSAEYRELQREIITTESKLNNFKGQLRKIGNVKLKAVSEQFKEMGSKLESAGQAMLGLSAAAGAAVASIGAMTYKAAAGADDLNTLAKVTGIGTRELQKYGYAADLVDVSVDSIAKSNRRLTKSAYSAANGSTTQSEAFSKLGVSVTDSSGQLRSTDAIFSDVISALGKMTNETERDAIAQQLMGKSAAELNPLIEDGGETYKMVAETLKKYNLDYVDQETLDKANQFNDSLDQMKLLGSVAIAQVGSQLAAYLVPAIQKVVDWAGQLASWLGNLDPRILTIISAVAGFIAVLGPLLIGLGKLATGISAIINLVQLVGPMMAGMGGTIGIVVAVIAALVAVGILVYKNWDKIKAKALEVKEVVVNAWNALKARVAAIFNGIKSAISTAWNVIKANTVGRVKGMVAAAVGTFLSLKAKATSTFNAIKNAIMKPIQTAVNTVKKLLSKVKGFFPIKAGKLLSGIKLPHFKISGSFSIKKKTVPHLSIDWYKTGGIFNSPTIAGIGDVRGGEAVVPLDKFWKKLENLQGGDSYVLNIYANDGMNVDQLVSEIQRRIIETQNRKRVAYGGNR